LPKKSEQPIDASQAMPGGVTIPQEMQRDGMTLGFGNEVAVALSFRSAPSNEGGPLVEAGEKQEIKCLQTTYTHAVYGFAGQQIERMTLANFLLIISPEKLSDSRPRFLLR